MQNQSQLGLLDPQIKLRDLQMTQTDLSIAQTDFSITSEQFFDHLRPIFRSHRPIFRSLRPIFQPLKPIFRPLRSIFRSIRPIFRRLGTQKHDYCSTMSLKHIFCYNCVSVSVFVSVFDIISVLQHINQKTCITMFFDIIVTVISINYNQIRTEN